MGKYKWMIMVLALTAYFHWHMSCTVSHYTVFLLRYCWHCTKATNYTQVTFRYYLWPSWLFWVAGWWPLKRKQMESLDLPSPTPSCLSRCTRHRSLKFRGPWGKCFWDKPLWFLFHYSWHLLSPKLVGFMNPVFSSLGMLWIFVNTMRENLSGLTIYTWNWVPSCCSWKCGRRSSLST